RRRDWRWPAACEPAALFVPDGAGKARLGRALNGCGGMDCRDRPGNDGGWGLLALSFPCGGMLRQSEAVPGVNMPLHPVTTGLVPVVHGILRHCVDCRDRPGNDGGWG